jgi:pyruvate/2-oxoglutarate dehydrogenase complex dihydrolipoamide acyltransferase (E2) component
MTKWWVAQDSFTGESADGAWLTVHKGQTRPDGDPLVALDRSEAERAAKAGTPRTALFAPQDFDEDEEPAPKPAAKAPAPSRKGA